MEYEELLDYAQIQCRFALATSTTIQFSEFPKLEYYRSASQIVRLIRNAFAHNPFAPVWRIPRECENQTYNVNNTIALKTSGLNGKPLERLNYGGPLALLCLLEFIKQLAQKSENRK
jgi:hypothetical protein